MNNSRFIFWNKLLTKQMKTKELAPVIHKCSLFTSPSVIVHIREEFSSSQSISRLIIPLNHQRWVENYICSYLFHKSLVVDIWHYVADRLPSQQKSTTQISTVMEASVWTFCAPSGHPPSRYPKVREHKYGLFIINTLSIMAHKWTLFNSVW